MYVRESESPTPTQHVYTGRGRREDALSTCCTYSSKAASSRRGRRVVLLLLVAERPTARVTRSSRLLYIAVSLAVVSSAALRRLCAPCAFHSCGGSS